MSSLSFNCLLVYANNFMKIYIISCRILLLAAIKLWQWDFFFFFNRSNCVVNLSPDKASVLREAYNVLKVLWLTSITSKTWIKYNLFFFNIVICSRVLATSPQPVFSREFWKVKNVYMYYCLRFRMAESCISVTFTAMPRFQNPLEPTKFYGVRE